MITVDGLISGFDTSKLIKEILNVKRRRVKLVEAQIEEATSEKKSYQETTAKLVGLQTMSNKLANTDLFSRVKVSSSNESVAVASGNTDLVPGNYLFEVAQLARKSRFASTGFATSDETSIGAGTLTLETALGSLDRSTELEDLNGGAGVERGEIRITDRSGNAAVVDLSAALTVDEVIDKINDTSGVGVVARLAASGDNHPGEAIVIEDVSGGSAAMSVSEVGSGNTARDLGIEGSASASVLQGSDVMNLTADTFLRHLNGGNGVSLQSGNDISFTLKDGSSFSVDLSDADTVGDVLSEINANDGVTAGIASNGNALVIEDTTSGSGDTTVAEVGDGTAARDLGIRGSFSGSSLTGDGLVAGINTVLLRELRGGSGIEAGSIEITDRAQNSATIDLSSAETIREVREAINNTAGVSVEAVLNKAGDGVAIRDLSGGTGALSVSEVGGGSTASGLGILSSGVESDEIDGEDLKLRYVTPSTSLSVLNDGMGVAAGSIRITDRSGRSFTVNLAQEETIGDVVEDINGASSAAGSDVTASVNDNGNGITLTASEGSGTLSVAEVDGGTTAKDLRIVGSASESSPGTIDGSYESTVTITGSMTLEDLKDEIENLGLGLHVAVVNDGSSEAPYRLSITGAQSGAAGGLLVRTSGTGLQFQRLSKAQDSVVVSGGGEGGIPLLFRSETNTFKEAVPGLTLTAVSASETPVEISAGRDDDKLVETISKFVEDYNSLVGKISDLTGFDPETEEAGLLLGDSTLRGVKRSLSRALTRRVTGNPSELSLASNVGLRLGPGGKLVFSSSDFRSALASDREHVVSLFTAKRQIEEDTELSDFGNGNGVDAVQGKADFQIHTRDGGSFSVDIGSASTVREVLNAINSAEGNDSVTAAIGNDGRRLVLTDTSTGSSTFEAEAMNSSPVYNQLGINLSPDVAGGGKITGTAIDLTNDWGIGGRLLEALKRLVDTDTGSMTLRSETAGDRIESLKDRKTALEERLTSEEARLRREFAQLETIMGTNQNTLQRLQATLGSVQGINTLMGA